MINKIALNPQNFTSNSEKSNKTNAGKFLGLGISGGYVAAQIINKGGYKAYKEDARKEFAGVLNQEYSKALGHNVAVADLTGKELKNMAYSRRMWQVGLIAIACVGIGAIVDWIVNASRH